MRRLVLIIPGWLGKPDEESVLRNRPILARLAARCEIFKLSHEPATLFESACLGLRGLRMAEGPLTIAAFGKDPPASSTQFHLSLLSTDGETLQTADPVPDDHWKPLMAEAAKLSTKKLTIVTGEKSDHGLVWEEGSLELGTISPDGATEWRKHLPEGDGEGLLRQFIDDSVNLLSEHQVNRERLEEGLPPLNLLWPWGQGRRLEVPNLALRLGEVVTVQSNSRRLAGLTRLVGWKHWDRTAFGHGTALQLEEIRANLIPGANIVVVNSMAEFRAAQQWDEMDWLTSQIEARFLSPLMDLDEPIRIAVLSPEGLGMVASLPCGESNSKPFDERTLEEPLKQCSLAQAVWESISP